jgi:predicted nucleotidyltransferase
MVAVHPLVESHRKEIEALCRKRRVRALDLFGSAAREGFDAARSDLDFLVEFLPLKDHEHADAYFGLLEDLRDLFGRPVDLVMTRAIRNPYFLEGVNRSRVKLYAA